MQRLVVFFALLAHPLFAGTEDRIEFRSETFRTFACEPAEVRLFWKDAGGNAYGNFARLNDALAARGEKLAFAMNGGIFEPGGIPTGLHIEDGKLLHPLNLKSGRGNFFLKPNGVFFIDARGAHVVESSKFPANGNGVRLAVQSGPLLLDAGRVHPAFLADSPSRLRRNGVGVLADGRVLFAMTDDGKRVNLYEFAEFFRSRGCRDALFLDGDISMLWTPADGPPRPVNDFAAILGVAERRK